MTGYQIISLQNANYNYVQTHWYDRFVPQRYRPQPGSRCEPHLFSVGDPFITNHTVFNWAIQNILTSTAASAGYAGVAYRGITLDSCDVVSIGMQANLMTRLASFAAGIYCLAEDFPVAASTFFTVGDQAVASETFNTELRYQISSNLKDPLLQVTEV